uniref:Kazal-like domain-containing protein n=2 Tax=Heliothis virescens TaxID=7102 RepID=A0A2A4JJI5_HELVI
MLGTLPYFILVLIFAHIVTSFVFNETAIDELEKKDLAKLTRRTGKRNSRSTSSSSGHRSEGGGGGSADKSDDAESLQEEFSEDSSPDTDEKPQRVKKDRTPKSTVERKGWRKWHRKCPNCPEDMRKKWRDPSIKWICGAYQRARRTFKSLCMMHYRNCQDGTMFTKIADHRCANGSGQVRPYNHHFFYDYNVALTGEAGAGASSVTTEEEPEESSWDTSMINKLPPLRV